MSKRKRTQLEDIEEDEGSWLLSYADMMTLIACFFILMMAFAKFDPVGFTKKSKIISQHFNKDKYKNSETKMKILSEEIAKHPEIKTKSKITVHDSQIVISFSGTVLFEEGGYILSNEATIAVDTLIDIIKTFDPGFNILVEGHSDNQKNEESTSELQSSWAIAGARAAAVVERFEYFGFEPKNLKAISWGDSKPLLANTDKEGTPIEENIKMNRRVVIKVIEPLNTKEDYKLGLGVYFD